MFKPYHLLVFFAIIGGFAYLVPQGIRSDDSGLSLPAASEPAQVQSMDWYGGETILERQSDGHFYAEGTIEGMQVQFLVDTGASVVALTGDDAYDLGLNWNEDDVRVIGSGASGAVYGVQATINEVEVGGHIGRQVRAVIIPEGLQISLLGQSFLSQVDNVEISGDQMVLGGNY